MTERNVDLRECPTAYECRDRLPGLSEWMGDDNLKLIRIWKGARFERGQEYFDLDNPDRGAFVATGDEGAPTDYTYACRAEVPERVWSQLVMWRGLRSDDQARAQDMSNRDLGIGREHSAAGEARPLPRS